MSCSKRRELRSQCPVLPTTDNGFADIEYKSKTQKKKEAMALQVLGAKLVKLSAKQLEQLHLPGEICDAVRFAKTIRKHGAFKRQIQYIGALMRKIDAAPVHEALHKIEQGS